MVTIVSEVRLANLELLVTEKGTLQAVADAAETSSVYLSQVRNRAKDSKTGKPREMGAKIARKLEKGAHKPRGWMDQQHPAEGSGSQAVAHDLSHHMAPDRTPLVPWGQSAVAAKIHEQFRSILPDDALGRDYPAGTEILWTSPTKRLPKIGRQALVIDDAGVPHARWLGQGARPGELTAVSHDPLYRSFDGVAQRFEVVAVFKAKVEPDDQ